MLFILLAIASGGLYLFFIMSLTSLGYGVKYIGLVIKYGWDWLQEYRRVAAGQAASTTPLSLPPFRFDLWIFAAFGVLFITLLSHSDLLTAILLTVCAPCCLWLWGKSQKNAKAIVELDQKRNKTQEELKRLKNMRTMQPLGFVIFLAAPLLVGGVTGQFLDGVMRLVNVRNDTAVSQMDQVTQQNAALVEEAAAATDQLANQADHLTSLVAVFKVSEHVEKITEVGRSQAVPVGS
jgi:hypothetical protein